jgi:uncharacterized radical SAM superfamily Fe-S cluster-containing enzyme
MLNTNGIRIAQEDGFAERLATYAPGFEVYLQFDSLRESALRTLRGADLRRVREQALAKLNALDLSTTLVVTVRRGSNDDELGDLLRFALAAALRARRHLPAGAGRRPQRRLRRRSTA